MIMNILIRSDGDGDGETRRRRTAHGDDNGA
jgi:hypothetical protein